MELVFVRARAPPSSPTTPTSFTQPDSEKGTTGIGHHRSCTTLFSCCSWSPDRKRRRCSRVMFLFFLQKRMSDGRNSSCEQPWKICVPLDRCLLVAAIDSKRLPKCLGKLLLRKAQTDRWGHWCARSRPRVPTENKLRMAPGRSAEQGRRVSTR